MREAGCRRRADRRGGWGGGSEEWRGSGRSGGGRDNGGKIINTPERASRGAPGWRGVGGGGPSSGLGGLMCLGLRSQFLFHDPCPGPEGCHPGALPPSIKKGL